MMLLRDRADVAVVTRAYLRAYQQRYPEHSSALPVSQRVDQVYSIRLYFDHSRSFPRSNLPSYSSSSISISS
jgi:hypothetical protein